MTEFAWVVPDFQRSIRSKSEKMSKEGEKNVRGEIEVLVEHSDRGIVNRRVVSSQNDLQSLKLNVLKGFQDVLTHKVATSTGLSSAAIHDVANKDRVLDVIHLMFFSEKYNKYIDLLDVALVKNGTRISVEVKFNNAIVKKVKPTEREIKNDKEDEKHDIAFELGSLKIHIHYDGGGEHHRFKPYWVDFTDLTEAIEMFPSGKYRLWCPIYSSGQGFMQTGSVANQSPLRYQVMLTGFTSIQIKDNTADTVDQQDTTVVQLNPGSCDLCTRIFFVNQNAYLCYQHSTGAVFAMENPGQAGSDYEFYFKVMRASAGRVTLANPFKMYFQIFNKDGKNRNGDSHLLTATSQNGIIRVIENIHPHYPNIASFFAISKIG